jgi:L-threonylcarbamoyladenylate synthase
LDIEEGRMQKPLTRAVEVILTGGVLVYPTETLYALGGDATRPGTVAGIEALKNRPLGKPFPVLIGSWELLWTVVDRVPREAEEIMRVFWPGPLSILVPGKEGLPSQIRGEDKMVCVRWTSHPFAAALSRESGRPLIATSANLSNQPPASRPWELDGDLAVHADLFVQGKPWPTGGLPSTIIRCEEQQIKIIRVGAVPRNALEQKGFVLAGPNS